MSSQPTSRRASVRTRCFVLNVLSVFDAKPKVVPAMDIGITQNDTEDRGLGDRDPLEPFPSDFTMFYVTTERQANECLEHITGGDVGFDAEFTKRRPTAEESLIDLALTTGPAHKKAAILGWQIVELGSGSFTVAWDNIGLRLVQIAHEDNVWVFDMWKIRAIPKELVRILLSPNIKKGGVALSNDITVVWDDLRIEMRNMVDVGLMSKLALIGKYPSAPYTNLSLKVAVEDILGFAIEKDLGKSNWAADKLLDDQIQYAALDAVASLRLLQALGSMLDKAMVKYQGDIAPSWYTFNSRRGEPTRIKPSLAGEVVPWRPSDCTWFAGGKFVGPP